MACFCVFFHFIDDQEGVAEVEELGFYVFSFDFFVVFKVFF